MSQNQSDAPTIVAPTPEQARALWESIEKPTFRKVGEMLGVSQTTIANWKRHGWMRKGAAGPAPGVAPRLVQTRERLEAIAGEVLPSDAPQALPFDNDLADADRLQLVSRAALALTENCYRAVSSRLNLVLATPGEYGKLLHACAATITSVTNALSELPALRGRDAKLISCDEEPPTLENDPLAPIYQRIKAMAQALP